MGDMRLTDVDMVFVEGSSVRRWDKDLDDCLHEFVDTELHTEETTVNGQFDVGEHAYIDNDGNNIVSPGDQRLTHRSNNLPVGSIVVAGDADENLHLVLVPFQTTEKYSLSCYLSGTSMATPIVAGEVAHFWCQYHNLNHLEVKDWILRKVDPRSSLQNTVDTGINNDGRLRMISGFDFGDAPDPYSGVPGKYPTVLNGESNRGASHEDMGEEWLGWDTSPEYDANVYTNPAYDTDDTYPNLLPNRIPDDPHPDYVQGPNPNWEVYDDGVHIKKVVFSGNMLEMEIHMQVENPGYIDIDNGRYDEWQSTKRAEKKIYVNAYVDWNQDGVWDVPAEHIFNWWGGPSMYCSQGIWWPKFDEHANRTTTFAIPDDISGKIWMRVRLDYGENVGQAPYPRYDSQHPFFIGALDHTYSHAQFGEVEDYVINIIRKIKVIGEPQYNDNANDWLTEETPIELIDYPVSGPYDVWNYYRLWYDEAWTDWMLYDPDMPLHFIGEGEHGIEFYGKAKMENQITFSDTFSTGPHKWTISDLDNITGNTWQWRNITPSWLDDPVDGYCMILNDQLSYELANKDSLVSGPISCTMLNNTRLSFHADFRTTGMEKLYVNLTNDGGTTWNPLLLLDEDVSDTFNIDIADDADGNHINLNFTYVGSWNMGFGAVVDSLYILGDYITYSNPHVQYHLVDETPPTSVITPIHPYNQGDIPFPVSAVPTDIGCGVLNVSLFYRHSLDNATWTDWMSYATNQDGIWQFHAPVEPAYYQFHAIAIDYLGNEETFDGVEAIAYVDVNNQPLVDFTYSPAFPEVGLPIQFTDLSLDSDGELTNWSWTFDDGNTSTMQHPTHSYSDSGCYHVTLTATDDDGASDSHSKLIPVGLELLFIQNLSSGWNFMSLPFNNSIDKTDFLLKHDGYYYGLDDGIINKYMFGWNRVGQYYTFANTLEPGFGNWVFAYENCELWIENIIIDTDDYITSIELGWNSIGIPYDQPVNKVDLLVDDVEWNTAVANLWVNNYIFGWNRAGQYYDFADTLLPGHAYWLYAYQPCVLKRT
jgi:PKD repeat protein